MQFPAAVFLLPAHRLFLSLSLPAPRFPHLTLYAWSEPVLSSVRSGLAEPAYPFHPRKQLAALELPSVLVLPDRSDLFPAPLLFPGLLSALAEPVLPLHSAQIHVCRPATPVPRRLNPPALFAVPAVLFSSSRHILCRIPPARRTIQAGTGVFCSGILFYLPSPLAPPFLKFSYGTTHVLIVLFPADTKLFRILIENML